MAIVFDNPVTAGTVLVRSDIRSQNYAAGVSGWIIEADGDAEFNNLTIRGEFLGTTFILNEDGLFIYSAAPALGNLIASIAPAAGVDAFGNAYLEGVASYAGGAFAALAAGNLLMGLTADGYPTAGLVGLSGTDGVFLSSPTISDPDAATIALVAGDNSVTPRSGAGYPHMDVGASTGGVTQWINGAVIASSVSGGVSTAETWHTPAFAANWATTGTLNGNATFRGLQYRRDAEDNGWLLGAAVASGAGATITTLPAGYRPPANQRVMIPCWIFDSSAGTVQAEFVQVTEAGVVNAATTLSGITIAAGDQVFLNGKFPLGNVA